MIISLNDSLGSDKTVSIENEQKNNEKDNRIMLRDVFIKRLPWQMK